MKIKTIGEKIKAQRKKCGLTQKELANNLGVSGQSVSSWESDRTEPNINMIMSLNKILETDLLSNNTVYTSCMQSVEVEWKLIQDVYTNINKLGQETILKKCESILYENGFLKKGEELIAESAKTKQEDYIAAFGGNERLTEEVLVDIRNREYMQEVNRLREKLRNAIVRKEIQEN